MALRLEEKDKAKAPSMEKAEASLKKKAKALSKKVRTA
jgi:hypothetical protein